MLERVSESDWLKRVGSELRAFHWLRDSDQSWGIWSAIWVGPELGNMIRYELDHHSMVLDGRALYIWPAQIIQLSACKCPSNSVEFLRLHHQLTKTYNWLSLANPTNRNACHWLALLSVRLARNSWLNRLCQLVMQHLFHCIAWKSWTSAGGSDWLRELHHHWSFWFTPCLSEDIVAKIVQEICL